MMISLAFSLIFLSPSLVGAVTQGQEIAKSLENWVLEKELQNGEFPALIKVYSLPDPRFEIGKALKFRVLIFNHGEEKELSAEINAASCLCGGDSKSTKFSICPNGWALRDFSIAPRVGEDLIEFQFSLSVGELTINPKFEMDYKGTNPLTFSSGTGESESGTDATEELIVSVRHSKNLSCTHISMAPSPGLNIQKEDFPGERSWQISMKELPANIRKLKYLPPIYFVSQETGQPLWKEKSSEWDIDESLVGVPVGPFIMYELLVPVSVAQGVSEESSVSFIGSSAICFESIKRVGANVKISLFQLHGGIEAVNEVLVILSLPGSGGGGEASSPFRIRFISPA